MGCGCGGGAGKGTTNTDTLGYRAILPNKEVVPPRHEPPFFMASEAMREVTQARGGTVRRIRKTDQDDHYAMARAATEQPAPA